jgi:DNA invertase Pin-like site-specific DNA recombinase
MRSAIYARYSTDKQKEASIPDQFRETERTAASIGAVVVGRFSDAGVSGGVAARPGYQALLEAARRKEFEIIIAEDVSRLWRNRATFGADSAELEDLGVHLVTCTGDDTRRDGYGLVLGIKSAIAEHQRREIAYRTRRGMEGLAAKGESTGGRCFGFGSPAEADTVRRVYRERLAGLGYREIADGLERDGIVPPRGGRWSRTTLRRILANPRYAGQAIWGKTQRKTLARDGARGRPVMRPGGPLVTRAIPALVDPLDWAACNPGRAVV